MAGGKAGGKAGGNAGGKGGATGRAAAGGDSAVAAAGATVTGGTHGHSGWKVPDRNSLR
jgi:hypothetical protein